MYDVLRTVSVMYRTIVSCHPANVIKSLKKV